MHFRLIKASHASLLALIFVALGCGPGTKGSADEDGESSGTPGTTSAGTGAATTTDPTTTAGSVGGTGTDTGETTAMSATVTTVEPTSEPVTTGMTSGGSEDTGGLGCGLSDCVDATEILQIDGKTPSGLVRCADGTIHRVAAVACVVPQIATDCLEPLDGSTCLSDADCVEHGFGTCREQFQCGFTAAQCGCVYGCESDADCDAGQLCLCAGDGNFRSRCVAAGCATDADCGGQACAASTDPFDAPTIDKFQCHAADDMCCGNADCELGGECRFDTLTPGVWACDFGGDCGRPLRIDGHSEIADEARRGDWQALAGLLQVPGPDVCAALAEHWSWIGRMEHASVGSFARFILQLLAVGAPAELVTAAQQALADEVEHARVCFALASAYGGRAVGPGSLPAACGALVSDMAEVVRAVIEEACVGETLSALEVAEAAARAEDPAVAAMLTKIAEDEARHAALGWSFVRWALGQDEGLRARADTWLAEAARAAGARGAAWTGDTSLRRHGVVDPGLRAALVQDGLAAVIRPCAAALRAAA